MGEWINTSSIMVLLFWFLVAVVTMLYIIKQNKYWKERGIPFIKPLPVVGNALKFFLCREWSGSFFRRMYENSTDPLVGIFILNDPCLLVRDLNLVKKILIEDFDYFTNRAAAINFHADPLGTLSLFASRMPWWYNDRKNLSPLFTSGKLRSKIDQIIFHGTQMIDSMKNKISDGEEVLNIKQFTNKFTVNTILSAYFGVIGVSNKDSPFLELTKKLFNGNAKWSALQVTYMYMAPKLFKLFQLTEVDNQATTFFRDLAWHLVNEREKLNQRNNDLIDILLAIKQKENLHEKHQADSLAAHCFTIFAAGFETTSTTLTFTLFELAKNPKCQDMARNEARTLFENYGQITYEGIKDSKYLKCCLLETLRMYPIDGMVDRCCTKDYTVPGTNVTIEKGTRIFISVWGIQNDPIYHENPSYFNPDRFKNENSDKLQDFSFLAFGDGPRHCPGRRFSLMSSMVCLAIVLLNFEVKLPEGSATEVKAIPFGRTFQPQEEIYLSFTPI